MYLSVSISSDLFNDLFVTLLWYDHYTSDIYTSKSLDIFIE